ncbi:PH domain-containing protein [Pseudobacillus badius]|uniref:PH domain-containing protein n=1 Tax=Bacillus badius TaxID=1455 RepID=UPI003CEB6879
MVYHSKPDVFSIVSIFLLIWIMGVVSLVPFITSFAIGIIMSAIFVISAIFIWWYAVSIQYVFCEDDLLIKGGPFQNKIPYESIRRVAPTSDKLTGYRISAADKGLELFYQRDVHGSIKILPKDKMQFISELKKRCPNVQLPPNQTFE